MTQTLTLVVYMAVLTWLTLLAGSLLRTRAWTLSGTMLALGNRDNLPPPGAVAGRAIRTSQNTFDNFVLFSVIALVAHVAGVDGPKLARGAEIFFWARVAYIPVYYLGIIYLRTAIWLVSIVGLVMMVGTVLA